MLNHEDKKQLIKIAKMYYLEELTQAAIAKKVGVSRPVISKMLQRAKDEGIVEITIHDDGFDLTEWEQQIASYYHLRDVVIVSTEDMNAEAALTTLGRAAAQFVSKAIRGAEVIGVSWGKSLHEMILEYPIERRDQIKVIPLVGGIGSRKVELHSNQIAYEWAKKMNAQCESLYAPAFVESEELKEDLIRQANIASVIEQGKSADVAIVGIGNPYEQSTLYELGYLSEEDLQSLKQANVMGDIGSHYILANGQRADDLSLNRRVIGIELEGLKNIPKVIGVAAGHHKVPGIKAALRGGYLDILITDDQTAKNLLEN
ncbi:DNA-binding transcriptional regulator LsrR, DeoR family [Seinonella peptonophila]|uniref:DNA-binding transcriptional regulator LsrR, DeoR family n=1 Tax=Seinonella peptonophila TaxID=112248 RepID=A0A1M4WDP4_9BACL|nr:sugar-binding transcriptional regulator [Seinonella peptonophila]SHE79183.1 DNA-binding transcriptional regulator LsrR, DeoR family [Seinonella peptonophila]